MSSRRPYNALSIRMRTAGLAVIVVGVALAIGTGSLLLVARAQLRSQIGSDARARAQDIALLAQAGAIPGRIPGQGEALLVQVLDTSGTVTASSPSVEGQPALMKLKLLPGDARTFTVPRLSPGSQINGEGGADTNAPFLISAVGTMSTHGPVTVVVAASLDPMDQLVDALTLPLSIGVPLALFAAGLMVWLLTGLALRPVESIRTEAESISATQLHRRVPLPAAHDEIGRLAETMNTMLDRLEASSLAQRRFVADASHELKSPVAAIRTMLEVARANPGLTDTESLLEDLATEDARLEHLVADLLDLARADEHELVVAAVDVDLDDLARTEAMSVNAVTGVRVDLTAVRSTRIIGDAERLRQLSRNLLDNASMHAAGHIWVEVFAEGETAVMLFSDDGPGIAEDDRERVFERFVRLDDARGRNGGGTGLGLPVARAIARAHGGDVRAVAPRHGGATFEVRLPITPRG
jgi:signal transduction histidine kinase